MTPNKIAVTGGMGSGKSAVLAFIRELGFPAFSCDEFNRGLWQEEGYVQTLKDAFPDCCTDGVPDKKKIAARVFSDDASLEKLNALAHPRILHAMQEAMAPHPVAFCEVPLLFESGTAATFDAVLDVRRDKEARIASVIRRDGLTREQALARMARQVDHESLPADGCIVLTNDAGMEDLRKKTADALRSLGLL